VIRWALSWANERDKTGPVAVKTGKAITKNSPGDGPDRKILEKKFRRRLAGEGGFGGQCEVGRAIGLLFVKGKESDQANLAVFQG